MLLQVSTLLFNLPAEFQMSRLNHRLDVIKDEKRTGVILQP